MGLRKRKICLLGTFGVGKTSLVQRFVNDRFDDKYLTTVGLAVSQKIMPQVRPAQGGETVQHMFLIWDIAGVEKFDSVVKNYFRGASGALAVGDLTRPETVDGLITIVNRFVSVCPKAAVVPIANKIDLLPDPTDNGSPFRQLADDLGSELILTSAKTGERVEDAFGMLSRMIEAPNG